MSFATPIALLFLGLFVPTILLYLLKQRRRRVEVSTLMFWDQILRDEQTVTSLTKLRKWLSLLLQLLFIALLTLALARPLLSGRLTGARRIVLLVDTSASMLVQEGKETRFDQAKRKAMDVVRGMSLGDSLMLVSMAAAPEIVRPLSDHKKELLEAIQKLEPVHTASNPKSAIPLLELLPPDTRATEVYLVSDGAFDPLTIAPLPNTRFAYLRVGAEKNNLGITGFQVRPLPSTPRDFQILLEITNQSEKDQTVPVELRMSERLADVYEYKIPAGKSITRTLRQFSAHGGPIEVRLGVDDAFPLDNRAYALLPAPKPVRVRLVAENNVFLERALGTDDEVELEVVAPGKYSESNPPDVTVFAGWHPPRTPPGNSIFIADWPEDLGLIRRGEITKPLFTDWQRDHPINRHLALQNVSIEKCIGLEPSRAFERLASSFSEPLILLRDLGTQKIMVTTFDTTTTDLPLRVAFPILMANTIRFLAREQVAEAWMNPTTGSILAPSELERYLLGAPRTNSVPITAFIDPDGRKIASPGQPLPINKTGFYSAQGQDGSTVPVLAANLASASESRIQPATTLPLRSTQGNLAQIEGGFRLGLEPWFFLATVGLLLSTVEWGLYHRRVIE